MGRKKIERPEADRIKSILITKTAIKELTSEDVVEKVIMFQFKDFRKMVFEHDQVEITGFGKFLVSPNKVRKKEVKLHNSITKFQGKLDTEPDASGSRKEYWTEMVRRAHELLEDLKTRTNGYENKH